MKSRILDYFYSKLIRNSQAQLQDFALLIQSQV